MLETRDTSSEIGGEKKVAVLFLCVYGHRDLYLN